MMLSEDVMLKRRVEPQCNSVAIKPKKIGDVLK